ncbi:polysaccharide biosynthesis/export family protein [Nodosilinea sp. E11]|uniref:polysaccharide biosynthesis/export family protein n=1 Tax=Nodosilinea sp. E11 TaxID=3037479 RepID=UPI002934DFDF|nr:polysaccharide biosynthesis/export family protein [Nodosilinea sp. E11]WOD39274.1 polysaccharide biosynthesis/export family protein [Nodosilinea sp. E11]
MASFMVLQNYCLKSIKSIGLGLVVGVGAIAPIAPVLAQSMQQVTQAVPASPAGLPMGNPLPLQTVEAAQSLDLTYRLGTGDVIAIVVFGAEEYSVEGIVLQDGTINLPRVGQVQVQGLTLRETEAAIAARYSVFMRQPMVSISPVNLRPVRVAISGEVKRPGSYTVRRTNENNNFNTTDSRFPTLTEAISQAGGITARANISEVILRRPVGYNQVQTSRYNLWDLLQSGDLGKDIVLQGGDEIVVPTATTLTASEAAALASANFAPESINVYVAGEVERPGQLQVPLNTSLNEVLLNAGGFNRRRANVNTVTLVRLAADGTAQQQQIAVDFSQNVNDTNNPILQERDVIVVDRSGLTTFGDTTSTLLSPFTQILNSIFGFRRIFD